MLSDTIKNARQPQLAVASDGKVFITYGRDNVIYFAVKSDAAHGFSPSIFVARVSQMPLGVRRGSRIAVSGGGLVITAVDGRQGHGKDEDLHAWRSTDGGATWQGPVTINGETASAREGLHHLAASPDGTLYCVWLDLRVKGTRLYGAYSTDGGTVWTERLLYRSPDGSVCQCCQPQVAFDARGGLHVMWRNELAGNRDMYLMNSKDSGRTFDKPIKLGTGTWPLDACPMDGGGLAADAGGNVTTIWRRENDLYRCTPGEREGLLARGMQGWATTGPGGIYLTWITARPGAVMALLPGTQRPIKLAESGSDPVIAAAPNGNGPAVIAWEEPHGGQTNVEIRVVRQ
ncbi:MAG TPA: sialidase family protein [Pirellulales bacterium]|nr:sialidase family protein [Pirellulales bacterium]